MKRWYRKLHWQIILGLVAGLLYGILAANQGWGQFTTTWIRPFGEIFIRLLKLIAIPLVLTSLVTGVASLSDTHKLTRLGGQTIALYLITTSIAITLGLVLVNIVQPGRQVPQEMKDELEGTFETDVESSLRMAEEAGRRGPLQPVVDMVPDNFFESAANNRNMLQLVFVSIVLGIALIKIAPEKSQPVLRVFGGMNQAVIEIVHMIMYMAPVGVFALIARTITDLARDNPQQVLHLLAALGVYCLTVIGGLMIHALIVYPLLLRSFTRFGFGRFFRAIGPAQLLAFSTSSSGATLPVTMEQCRKGLGISDEVCSFVLPLGATINMDGTALYQAVAAVFISQVMGIELAFHAQLTIIFTALLASIGTAAVPSAGIIMLVIILEAIGVPSAGIALILGVDRILDMLRTTCNITGDATVAAIVASRENQIHLPESPTP